MIKENILEKKMKILKICLIIVLFASAMIQSILCAQPTNFESDSTMDALRSSLIKLNWAEKEVIDISEMVKGETFCHQNATEKTFKEKAPNASILHLATHAVINDAYPMYSKLILAPDTASGEDGFLNTYELYNMQLNANMAVLSACNTGYGRLVRGEGIISLARGFMYAGCPSIIMSLWPVDDRSTSELMENFYQGLRTGLPKDAALREAKLKYLMTADEAKANPFYWAGFVPIGNMDPIPLQHKSYYRQLLLVLALCGIGTALIFRRKIFRKA